MRGSERLGIASWGTGGCSWGTGRSFLSPEEEQEEAMVRLGSLCKGDRFGVMRLVAIWVHLQLTGHTCSSLSHSAGGGASPSCSLVQ